MPSVAFFDFSGFSCVLPPARISNWLLQACEPASAGDRPGCRIGRVDRVVLTAARVAVGLSSVQLIQRRRAEARRVRTAEQDRLGGLEAEAELRVGRAAEVAVLVVAAGDGDVQALDDGNVQLEEAGVDIALAGVERRRIETRRGNDGLGNGRVGLLRELLVARLEADSDRCRTAGMQPVAQVAAGVAVDRLDRARAVLQDALLDGAVQEQRGARRRLRAERVDRVVQLVAAVRRRVRVR